MNNFAAKALKWRADLEKIGGWDNEMVSVPAGAVRKIIEDLDAAADEIDRLKSLPVYSTKPAGGQRLEDAAGSSWGPPVTKPVE